MPHEYNFGLSSQAGLEALNAFKRAAEQVRGGGEVRLDQTQNPEGNTSIRGRICRWIRQMIPGKTPNPTQYQLATLDKFKTALANVYGKRAADNAAYQIKGSLGRFGLTSSLVKRAVLSAESFYGKGQGRRMENSVTIKIWPYEGGNHPGHAAVLVKETPSNREDKNSSYLSFWPHGESKRYSVDPIRWSKNNSEQQDFLDEMGGSARSRLEKRDNFEAAHAKVDQHLKLLQRAKECKESVRGNGFSENTKQLGVDLESLFCLNAAVMLAGTYYNSLEEKYDEAAAAIQKAKEESQEVNWAGQHESIYKAFDDASERMRDRDVQGAFEILFGAAYNQTLGSAAAELLSSSVQEVGGGTVNSALNGIQTDKLNKAIETKTLFIEGERLLEDLKTELNSSMEAIAPRPQQQKKVISDGEGNVVSFWGQRPNKFCLPSIGVNRVRTSKTESQGEKMVFFGLDNFRMHSHIDGLKADIAKSQPGEVRDKAAATETYKYLSTTRNCAGKAMEALVKGGAEAFAERPSALIAYSPNDVSAFAIRVQEEVDELNAQVDKIRDAAARTGIDFVSTFEHEADDTFIERFSPAIKTAFSELSAFHEKRFDFDDDPSQFKPEELMRPMKKLVMELNPVGDEGNALQNAELLRKCERMYTNILSRF